MSFDKNLYKNINIGSLELQGNLFLAPVAGYSDRAFRSLCVEYGASFTYTEMVSAEALVRDSKKTEKLLLRAENEKNYAIQIFGGNPESVALASVIAIKKTMASCIDINAGCPVSKICKTGAGASLTKEPEKLGNIVKSVKQRLNDSFGKKIPVTVKIRSGWDNQNLTWKEAAFASLDAGASAITLHPRTRAQGYQGSANWDYLASLKELVNSKHPEIPVFGSGDLFTPEDAKKMLEETNCDGIMFARGAMGNPFIFSQTIDLLKKGFYEDIPANKRLLSGWRELQQLVKDVGEVTACKDMRKRFSAYSKGIPNSSLLRSELVQACTVKQYQDVFKKHGFIFN